MPKKIEKPELKYAFCKESKTKWNIMERKSYLPIHWYTIATTTKEQNADAIVAAMNAAEKNK